MKQEEPTMSELSYSSGGPTTVHSEVITVTSPSPVPGSFLKQMTHAARHAYMNFIVVFTLSRQIRTLRKSRGWTQRQLAGASGLSVLTIQRLEKFFGCSHATTSSLIAIAAAFDVALMIHFVSWGEWVQIYIAPDGKFIQRGLGTWFFDIPTLAEDKAFLNPQS